jgi:rubrerythrin
MKITKYIYTCWHCGTGMVMRLPAICPECERMLTKEV